MAEEELEKESEGSEEKENENTGFKKYRILIVIFSLLAVCVAGVLFYFTYHVVTDDAQILGFKIPANSRLNAYVTAIYVKENQFVKKGDLLVELDSADFVLEKEVKLSTYEQAKKNIEIAKISKERVSLSLNAEHDVLAKLNIIYNKAYQDYKRNEKLFLESVIPLEVFSNFKTAYLTAKEDVLGEKVKIKVLESDLLQMDKELELTYENSKLTKSEYLLALRNLSYTKVYAPTTGTVSNQRLRPGQLVANGQNLFIIVERTNLWVTANFKETKIHKLKVGGKVAISVDAVPNYTYEGIVSSIGAASIAQFALIPPSNVTGNFIKVVQRVPVRIDFSPNPMDSLLRQGINVEVVYKVSG